MGIAVLIEPTPGGGFRAKSGPPFGLEAEASTRETAKQRLIEMIVTQMKAGAVIETVEISSNGSISEHPLAEFVGDMRDDPLFEPWIEAIRSHRTLMDSNEGL